MSRQSRDPGFEAAACSCAPLQRAGARARAVAHLARWYRAKGWTVRTRLPGWGRPPRIDGHVPDLYASDGGLEVAIDVVVPGEVVDGEALAHRAAFAAWQGAGPGHRRYFLEVVHRSGVNQIGVGAAAWADATRRMFG